MYVCVIHDEYLYDCVCVLHTRAYSILLLHVCIQAIPIVRGDGVYQKAVDYCINLLNEGAWIHVFPEGCSCIDVMFIASI